MKKFAYNKTFLLAITIGGFALAYFCAYPYAVLAGLVAALALMQLMRRIENDRNWKAIMGALSDYEEIIGGQLWSGKDAKILASDRLDMPKEPGPVRFEHICQTKSGAWFLFEVAVNMGRVVGSNLRPCDEATARYRLQRHQDAYINCFGKPTAA